MNLSRRRLLKAGVAAVAGRTATRGLVAAAEEAEKIPIGLQLYTVRGEFAEDVPGTLQTVARMGYQGVEFWGYTGTPNVYQDYSAKQLREMLDRNKLKCCGMHLYLKAIEPAQLPTTIENNLILGNRFLNVAAAKKKMVSEESIREFAAFLSETARKLRAEAMRLGFHAHPWDFALIEGRFAWDIVFSHTDPSVVMQMDIGNCLAGGGDPIAILKKFPGRAATIHLREREDKTFASDYYAEIFRLCENEHNTRWYIVEAENDGGKGFDVPCKALEDLKKIGKQGAGLVQNTAG